MAAIKALVAAEKKEAQKSTTRVVRKVSKSVDSLWTRFRQTKSIQSRNSLIEEYRGFVRDVARRVTTKLPKHIDIDDLEIAGIFGLIDSIQHYDPDRGVRFETYCEMRVRGAILDELRNQDWLPRQWRSRIAKRENAVDALRVGLGREPTEEEISQEMGIPVSEYRAVYGNLRDLPNPNPSRIDEKIGDDLDPVSEGIEDPRLASAFEDLCHREMYDFVNACLSVQEREIVYLKYFEALSIREIGKVMRISESRVYKIHAALLDRMKKRFSRRIEEVEF